MATAEINIQEIKRILTTACEKSNKAGVFGLQESYTIFICLQALENYVRKNEDKRSEQSEQRSDVVIKTLKKTESTLDTIVEEDEDNEDNEDNEDETTSLLK